MREPHDWFIGLVMKHFHDGMDTKAIAIKWICDEATVERALHIGLERRRADRQADELAEVVAMF
jgi:hypothetical protein